MAAGKPAGREPVPLITGTVEARLLAALTEYIDQQVAAQVEARMREVGAQKAGDEVLTVVDVAALKKRDPKTIRRWVREGLPATKRGNAWVIRRADLDHFLGGEAESTRASEAARILGSIGPLHPQ